MFVSPHLMIAYQTPDRPVPRNGAKMCKNAEASSIINKILLASFMMLPSLSLMVHHQAADVCIAAPDDCLSDA